MMNRIRLRAQRREEQRLWAQEAYDQSTGRSEPSPWDGQRDRQARLKELDEQVKR